MNMKTIVSTLIFAMHVTGVFSINDSYRVRVVNELSDMKKAELKCRSKDDDLGFHPLVIGEEFSWHFNTNIWGTTLFWCNFWKENGAYKASGKVFWEGKIEYSCRDDDESRQCDWYIRDDGIYARDFFHQIDVPYYAWEEVMFDARMNRTRLNGS